MASFERFLAVSCLAGTMAACVHISDDQTGTYSLRNYRETALELQDTIHATEIIPTVTYSSALNERIQNLAFTLMDVGQGISQRFEKKNLECKHVLATTRNLKSEIGSVNVEKLAKRFDLEESVASDKTMKCFQVRNLVVRPATIIVTLKQPIDRNSFAKLVHEVKQATDLTEEIKL